MGSKGAHPVLSPYYEENALGVVQGPEVCSLNPKPLVNLNPETLN